MAITTTAGTGSEADPGTVITNEETNEKTGYLHDDLFPVVSIVDPKLDAFCAAEIYGLSRF